MAGHPARDWTDFNTHDPGITLVELLGFLGDGFAFLREKVAGEGRNRRFPRRALAVGAVSAAVGVVWWRTRRRDGD
jgi:hypothetical protein